MEKVISKDVNSKALIMDKRIKSLKKAGFERLITIGKETYFSHKNPNYNTLKLMENSYSVKHKGDVETTYNYAVCMNIENGEKFEMSKEILAIMNKSK